MILILTGPTRSHKTTTLLQWANVRHDCGGILTPDHKGLRILYNVKEKKGFPFEKTENNNATDIMIGRFVFDAEGFILATHWLDKHSSDPDIQYMLIDEIGPLELSGHGLDHWLLSSIDKLGAKTLILVVRQGLVDEVIGRYQLKDVIVVKKDYFLSKNTSSPLDGQDDDAPA